MQVQDKASTSYLHSRTRFFLSTYLWMFLALLVTSLTIFTISSIPFLQDQLRFLMRAANGYGLWIATILQFFCIILFRPDMEKLGNTTTYLYKLVLYAFFTGLTLSCFLLVYPMKPLLELILAPLALFAGLVIYIQVSRTDMTGMASLAKGLLVGIILASLVNYFFLKSQRGDWITSLLAILVFSALILYDSHKLKTAFHLNYGQASQESLAIPCALTLYLDLINLATAFIHKGTRKR